MITSTRNPKAQWVRKLQAQGRARREAGAFVVEGVRLAEEALGSGWEARLVLHTADLEGRGQAVVDGFAARGVPVEQVSSQVMKAASDTQTPQGVLVVVEFNPAPLPEAPDFLLILDGVRDPGNLGTILRTAAAAGVQSALLPPGTVDVYAPKVVRAGMGAHFRLPVQHMSWEGIGDYLRLPSGESRLRLFLAEAQGGETYTRVDLRAPLALVIGGEAAGPGSEVARLAHGRVHIPMPGGVESLNAAVAAAILMFEVVRQRQATG